MKTNPTFPPSRLTDPQRRAERDIYQAVEASSVPGRALYEVKATREAKQVDILLWAEAVATFGAQLKGGTYMIRDGELCLVTDQGLVPKPGLLAGVWDSVMAIPEFIHSKLGRGMYIIPVLGLPDMEEDEAIRDMAGRRQVGVIFGKADWVQRLVGLASCHSIRHRPTEERHRAGGAGHHARTGAGCQFTATSGGDPQRGEPPPAPARRPGGPSRPWVSQT